MRPFSGLLMHFAEECGAQVIVRGLRAVADFEYEFQMTAMNQQLNREIETVFLMADPRHQAIASRLVKEIAALGGDVSPFVTPGVVGAPEGEARPMKSAVAAACLAAPCLALASQCRRPPTPGRPRRRPAPPPRARGGLGHARSGQPPGGRHQQGPHRRRAVAPGRARHGGADQDAGPPPLL